MCSINNSISFSKSSVYVPLLKSTLFKIPFQKSFKLSSYAEILSLSFNNFCPTMLSPL